MLSVLLIAAIAAVGDQIFKHWIVTNISLGGVKPFIPGVLHLTSVQNTGAAFSMMSDMRTVLLIITAVCIVAIIVFTLISKPRTAGSIFLGLVLGGAIGNAIDRVLLGYVVDMFELEFMEYAVFNVADCCIVVGGIAFCIYYLFFHKDEEKTSKKKKKAEEEISEVTEAAAEEDEKFDLDRVMDEARKRNEAPPEAEPETKEKEEEEPFVFPEEEVKTNWTETEILEEYSLDQILKDYYDKMD